MPTKAEVVEWLRYRGLDFLAKSIDETEVENDEFDAWKESEELRKGDV